MGKRICISIAVSRPEELEPLPGALTASADVVRWAQAAGFDVVRSVTDDGGQAVTVSALRDTLVPLLGDASDVIEHLVIHFAGHGFASGADDQYLLLTHWATRPDEAIRLSRFVRLLQFYQPGRVSLFLDACRSRLPAAAEDLNGSGILDRPREEPIEFLSDRFRAAGQAAASFMVKDPAGGDARCLFTTILLKALSGVFPEAREDRDGASLVTSTSIYHSMAKRFPEVALRYEVNQTPFLQPSFVRPNDVYVALPIDYVPPELPPPSRTAHLQIKGIAPTDIDAEPSPPDPRTKIADQARAGYRAEQLPTHFESDAGFAVNGAAIRGKPTVNPTVAIEQDRIFDGGSWWRVVFPNDGSRPPSSLAVQLADGAWIAGAVMAGMVLAVTVSTDTAFGPRRPRLAGRYGATSLLFRPTIGSLDEQQRDAAIDASEDIVSKLAAGILTDQGALGVAARIRHGKHVNPVAGAIAAYLYEAAGDRDSIRRLAWFYTEVGQPIPFDIALLADLSGRRAGGLLRVDLPAVGARKPRTEEEARHPDYFQSTSAVSDVVVAGGFPWLRQGWALLDMTRLPLPPAVPALADQLLPFAFTTLKSDAGKALAELIKEGEV